MTLPLPTRPGHVHSYLLPGEDGWTLVDTGIGLPDAKESWALELAQAGGRVATIFVTHFHPDHVGAAADLHELTGAPVVQGALDYAQCELVWGNPAWSERLVDWFHLHGAPDDVTEELVGQGSIYRPFIRYQRDPRLVEAGEHVDGWELVAAPGHADGQLCLAPRRRARRRRPSARPHHSDGRALAGEPSRSARRLPRRARPDDRARSEDRIARSRGPDRGSRRPGARAEGAPSRVRPRRRGARRRAAVRVRAVVRALRLRPPGRRGGALRSPRRSRTSSGSCSRARRCGTRSTGRLPILPPDQRGRRLPAKYRRP